MTFGRIVFITTRFRLTCGTISTLLGRSAVIKEGGEREEVAAVPVGAA